MVKKVFSLLNTEIRGLHKAAYLLGVAALASQILAIIRDRLLATTFGAGIELDIYFASFRIPDMVFVISASVVSLSALVPVLANTMQESEDKTKNLINSVFSFFSGLVIVLSALAFLLMPYIAPMLFPGFDNEVLANKFIPLSRIILLSPIFLGISNLFASITQLHSKFVLYAASPILYNVGIIIGIIFLYPAIGFAGLGLGVAVGAFMHMAVQLPFIFQSGLFPRFSLKLDLRALKDVIKVSVPRTVALASNHLSVLFLTMLGSLMASGAIAVFTLSYTLQSVPLSIIGVSYSVAAFPALSKLYATGKQEEFLLKMSASLRHIVFWSLPSMVIFIVLRAQIVRVIYGAGLFDWTATRLTAASLAVFSVSILAQGIMLLFVRGYYAAGRTKTPVVVNVLSTTLVIVVGLVLWSYLDYFGDLVLFLSNLMRLDGVPGAFVLVLPLSFSVGAIGGAVLIWMKFERDFGKLPGRVGTTLAQSFCSAVAMGAITFILLDIFDNIFGLSTAWGVFAQGFFAAMGGLVVGVVLLRLMGSRELSELHGALQSRIWKTRAILPGEEDRTGGL